MGARGRESSASLSVVTPQGVIAVDRPRPPGDLTEEQAREWVSIVARLPADWFARESHGLLVQYCRHVVRARRLAQLIEQAEKADEFDVNGYRALLLSEETQSRAIASLATKMRISQQTTYDKSRKKGSVGRKPWEIEGG